MRSKAGAGERGLSNFAILQAIVLILLYLTFCPYVHLGIRLQANPIQNNVTTVS